MTTFVRVAAVAEVPEGKGRSFAVAGKDVAIFNVEGSFYAMDVTCLHAGSSLASGTLDGRIVTCPGHGWRYDVTTGSTAHVPGYGVTSYPTKVENDFILLAID